MISVCLIIPRYIVLDIPKLGGQRLTFFLLISIVTFFIFNLIEDCIIDNCNFEFIVILMAENYFIKESQKNNKDHYILTYNPNDDDGDLLNREIISIFQKPELKFKLIFSYSLKLQYKRFIFGSSLKFCDIVLKTKKNSINNQQFYINFNK